jgi:phosphoglycerate kinase
LSHLGRPKAYDNPAQWDLTYSLQQLVTTLERVLKFPVCFINRYAGFKVFETLKNNPDKRIFLLENIRFAVGEESNSPMLADELAQGVDLYVNEAFSCSHRAHASIDAITYKLPSVAGLHFEKEVTYLEKCLSHPKRPLVAIVGGAKVSTKLELLENLCQKVDNLIIVGAMANTFLAAQGKRIGASLFEPELLSTAKNILETSKAEIILPVDGVVANNLDDAQPDIIDIVNISNDQKIFDIGPISLENIKNCLQSSKTIVCNGPAGVFEYPAFANGTLTIANIIVECTKNGVLTVAGGGDTLAALNMANAKEKLSYVSTAGGAFLEWLEGKTLPGLEALRSS